MFRYDIIESAMKQWGLVGNVSVEQERLGQGRIVRGRGVWGRAG